jgi:excisionase family DNA binding protein
MEQDILLTSIRLDELNTFIENSLRKVLIEFLPTSPPQKTQDLLSITEASKVLNLALPTIYGLVSTANIPNMKKGKKLYFSRHELEDWIKSGRRKTIEEKKDEANNILTKSKKSKKR